jgi:hypothetical protein
MHFAHRLTQKHSFRKKADQPEMQKEFAPVAMSKRSASSTHLPTMKDLEFGADFLKEKDASSKSVPSSHFALKASL